MEPAVANLGQLVDSSKQFARRLFIIGENRFELLRLEMQEERERLVQATLLMLGVAVAGFFALLALNIAVVVLLWHHCPVAVLLGLAALYLAAAIVFYRRLAALLQNWKSFSATLDQLQKDRACLEKNLL